MTATAQTFLFDDGQPAPRILKRNPLLEDLKNVLKAHADNKPRSQQRRLGPSEVGHPCARKLAGGMLQLDRINPEGDPLPAWIGTAAHAEFENAIELGNDPRWLSERRVTVRPGLEGTCDLYDKRTRTVVDLKFPGATKMTDYRRHGPSPEYRAQAHLYGRGYINEGYPVDNVAIWFIPRAGMLSTSFLWSEPYSDSVVDETLAKLDNIILLLDEFQAEANPERLAWFPRTPHNCQYCPFFTVEARHPNPAACRGNAP